MSGTAIAVQADLTTFAGQQRHYDDVRRRLMNRPTAPKMPVASACHIRTEGHDFPDLVGAPLNMLAPPSWRFLLRLAAVRNGASPSDILGDRRSAPVAEARHDAAYLMRQHLGWSYPAIGRRLNRDSSTIIHSCHHQRQKLGRQ